MDSQLASSHKNKYIDNASGNTTNQSTCSSDEECVDTNVHMDEDINTQINMFVCSISDCLCTGCTDLSILYQLRDIDKLKLVHSHSSKEMQDFSSLIAEKHNRLSIINIFRLVCVHHAYKSFCRTCHSAQQEFWPSSVLSSK